MFDDQEIVFRIALKALFEEIKHWSFELFFFEVYRCLAIDDYLVYRYVNYIVLCLVDDRYAVLIERELNKKNNLTTHRLLFIWFAQLVAS